MPDITLAYGQESSRGSLASSKKALKEGQLSLAYSSMPSGLRNEISATTDARLYFDLSNTQRIPINAYFADFALYASSVQTQNSNITKAYLLGQEYNAPAGDDNKMEGTPIYDTGVYLTATPGELAMTKLLITSTSGIKHIQFSRDSYNYLAAPAGGSINFFIGDKLQAATSTLSINASAISPGSSGTYDIGSSGSYWRNAYIQTLNNSTSAYLNGKVYIKGGTDYTATLEGPSANATFYFPGTGGTLVTHPTRGTAVGATNKPVYVQANGQVAAGSTYAGGTAVTLNGSSKGATTAAFYAPTDGGTAGQVLVAGGDKAVPKWTNQNALTGIFTLLTSTTAKNLSLIIGGTTKEIAALYATALSNTTAIGGVAKPVYFNASGQPTPITATLGGVRKPVYLNGGTITACDVPTSGKWYTGIVNVGSDGVMEMGRYLDLHSKSDTTWDYTTRITAQIHADTATAGNNILLPLISGEFVVHDTATQIGSGTQPVYVAANGKVTASTSSIGGTAKPVWLSEGVVTAFKDTIGGAVRPVYVNAGTITALSNTVGSTTKPIYMSQGSITASDATVGSGIIPMYMNAGTLTASTSTIGGEKQLMYLKAGTLTASTADLGSGAMPIYLLDGVLTASASNIGSGVKPIYMSAGTLKVSESTVGSGIKPVFLSGGTIIQSSSSVGSGLQPIFMTSGTLTASAATAGSAALPVWLNAGTITACTASSVFSAFTSATNTLSITVAGQTRTASAVNSVSNTWTNGTTGGPKIATTVNGKAGTAVAMPVATASVSGAVSTTTQTFAGVKTFATGIVIPTSAPTSYVAGQMWLA